MFDLANIDFIKTDRDRGYSTYSFVGLQRNSQTGKLEFWLPLGFDEFDHTDFNQVKSFFFRIYRTFRIYLQRKQDRIFREAQSTDRDGIIENEDGFSFTNENNDQVVFYGKLNALDKILEGYDELRITSLEKKQLKSDKIDYSQIHRYMHQAIYLDKDVIYIDEMNVSKSILFNNSPPILQIFCFIYTEIKKELEDLENIPKRAFELADQYRDNYLQPGSSLFVENSFTDTLNILRQSLDAIDMTTTYKDENYWHFFEAVESFLYGEKQNDTEGFYWGFSSFYDIWEDMCQFYVLNTPEYKKQVLFADSEGSLKKYNSNNEIPNYSSINPFELSLNKFSKTRKLRPDLVLSQPSKRYCTVRRIQNEEDEKFAVYLTRRIFQQYPKIKEEFSRYPSIPSPGVSFKPKVMSKSELKKFQETLNKVVKEAPQVQVIDYKYMKIQDYERYSPNSINADGVNKVKDDIQKQLIYEWSIQQNWKCKTKSEFWIPYFSSNQSKFDEIYQIQNPEIKKTEIKIVKINFNILQEFYINNALF
ncbi:hypothetical protein E1H12_18165 [Geitlerinema sp. P-1104]|uniref:hypothetical protein n=1 Tax=Geitlerinema sp. P-1104 TaxID=2546230 RepID=UPI0014769E01|nr:hypothetical protein [Geitlerinema sp. P-1104]NMG60386.1 hypothetical protein [Geitlerinema sp. P-1104]